MIERNREVIGSTTYNPAPISPILFAQQMNDHWQALGNSTSEKLLLQWQIMGEAFSRAVLIGARKLSNGGEENQWQILAPQTGTGKTQGACVYAAMVGRQNRVAVGFDRTGILIVCRLIQDADAIADKINALTGHQCALARHSDNRARIEEMARYDVLVITHQAYMNALEEEVLEHKDHRLENFIQWQYGPRFLTIIDESLSGLVKSYSASVQDFRETAASVDWTLRKDFPRATNLVVQDAQTVSEIENLLSSLSAEELTTTKQIWTGDTSDPDWPMLRNEFLMLRRAMTQKHYDLEKLGYTDAAARKKIAQRIDNTLATMEAMRLGGGYRTGKGGKLSIHTSKLLMPDELPGPVILDATAEHEPIWKLLGNKVCLAKAIDGVRSYRNVTLHILEARDVGKGSMVEKAETRLSRLFDFIGTSLQGRKVFVCLHKDVEYQALSYQAERLECSIDHWGNIDGRNDWQDCDTAILFGLPYLPNIWGLDLLLAVQAYRESTISADDEENSGTYKDQSQLVRVSKMAASVIQAMNRVRCRRVIDAEGNCQPTDIYLTLSKDATGEAILSAIKSAMPDIQIKKWPMKIDGDVVAVSKAHYAAPFLAYVEGCEPGETDLKKICEDLKLRKTAKKDLQADLRNPEHSITIALSEMGVTYHSSGRGPRARSYLRKQ